MGVGFKNTKPLSEERKLEREQQEKRPVFLFNNNNKNYFNEINKIITDFDLKNKLVALLKLEFNEKEDFTTKQGNLNEILISYEEKCHNGPKYNLKSENCQFWADEVDKEDTWEDADKDIKTVTEIKEAVDNIADFKKNFLTRMYTVTLKKTDATMADTAAVGGKKRKSLKKRRKSKKKSKRKSLKKKRKTRRR